MKNSCESEGRRRRCSSPDSRHDPLPIFVPSLVPGFVPGRFYLRIRRQAATGSAAAGRVMRLKYHFAVRGRRINFFQDHDKCPNIQQSYLLNCLSFLAPIVMRHGKKKKPAQLRGLSPSQRNGTSDSRSRGDCVKFNSPSPLKRVIRKDSRHSSTLSQLCAPWYPLKTQPLLN